MLVQIRFAILDEADRMLSDGFEEDVERILATSPAERQTLLFRSGPTIVQSCGALMDQGLVETLCVAFTKGAPVAAWMHKLE